MPSHAEYVPVDVQAGLGGGSEDLKPIYTAAAAAAALDALTEFSAKWGKQYGAVIRLWENAWDEFIPFLDTTGDPHRHLHDERDRVDQRALRRAVKARGHSRPSRPPSSALPGPLLDPTGKGRQRWTIRWKGALNAFAITFDDRLSAGRK